MRGPLSERTWVHKVLSSLLGRTAARHRRWRPVRALPLLAVGAMGVVALQSWDAGEAVPRAVDRMAEVAPAVELPMEMNERVRTWMQRFLTDQRETFEVFLARESIYSDMIRGKLRQRAMPEDLLYLAMIESGFSPRATSAASAAGVWQFMSPTARQYGLRVDRYVDERRDPVKATDAALDYLEFLHGKYDSWYLAAAAYNAGPGRVDGILRRHAGGRKGDEAIYWEIIEHLPRETRSYVPKLLAATALASQAERYGFDVKPRAAYEYDRVWVPGGTALSRVAAAIDVETSLMRSLNPHLVRGVTPPGTSYAVRVPSGSSYEVIAALGGGRLPTALADDD